MEIVELFVFHPSTNQKIPLYSMSVSAGYPVPVDSDIEKSIDLNEFLVEHPATTFFAKVRGVTLTEAGIQDNDILIVDSSKQPEDGKIIVVSINDELTVKIYRDIEGEIFLQSQNMQFLPIKIEPYLEFKIIGVVTKVIHSL